MAVSPSVFIPAIEQLITERQPPDVGASVRGIVDLCAREAPHPDWKAIRAIDWAADMPRLRTWFLETLTDDAPPAPLGGIYFACCQPVLLSGGATADLRFIGTREFDPSDLDQGWIFTRHYFPEAYADSAALDELYALAYRTHDWRHPIPGALGNDAEWPVGLTFSILAARTIVGDLTTRALPTKSPRVGIAAGWDEGDLLLVGEVTAQGFLPRAAT